MPVDATAPTLRNPREGSEIITQVVLERLADDLEELDGLVWAADADVARVRELAGESLMLALNLLDG